MENKLDNIRTIIAYCRYAAMKCWGLENILQKRCLTEALYLRDDGTLECIVHDKAHPTAEKSYPKNSKVDLKFVNKEQNVYVSIKGRVTDIAFISKCPGNGEPVQKYTVYFIRIMEAEFYERESFSPSLSFLLRRRKQKFITSAA